jgi:hypothetical protein
MNRAFFFSVGVGIFLLVGVWNGQAADELVIKADVLNGIKIQEPQRAGDKTYLGLAAAGPFTLTQVKADVLIVQIFSMYCPHCQADAPNVLNLCGLIDNDPQLKDRVKLLGLGLNNSWYEVDFFRDKYKIPFPMIPDEKSKLQEAVTETIRTPAYLVLKLTPGKPASVMYTKLRAIKDVEVFLKKVREACAPMH